MPTARMTIRGLLITIAVEGLVLGACIGSPWLIVVPVRTALVFVPQLVLVALCAYLATRECRARRFASRLTRWGPTNRPSNTASPEIWYIETGSRAADPTGIVFESCSYTPPH